MHDNLPLVTADDTLYAWESQLQINLYSEGKTWFDLDTTNIDSMKHIVQYNSAAGYLAGGLSALAGMAPVTWPMPVVGTAALDSAMTAIAAEHDGGRKAHGTGSAISPVSDVNNIGNPAFSIFPNPTYGNLTVNTTGSGKFTLYTLLGQKIREYSVPAGQTNLQLPVSLAAGMYIGEFRPDNEGETKEIKLVYQP
jgi:type IX secretion system substrate protein